MTDRAREQLRARARENAEGNLGEANDIVATLRDADVAVE